MSSYFILSILLSSMFAGFLSSPAQNDLGKTFLASIVGAVIGLLAGLASLGVLAILGVQQ